MIGNFPQMHGPEYPDSQKRVRIFSLSGFMSGELIDCLWIGVKATYIPLFATLRGSYNTVLQPV